MSAHHRFKFASATSVKINTESKAFPVDHIITTFNQFSKNRLRSSESQFVVDTAINLLKKSEDPIKMKEVVIGALLLVQIDESRFHNTVDHDYKSQNSKNILENIVNIVIQEGVKFKESKTAIYIQRIGKFYNSTVNAFEHINDFCFSQQFANDNDRYKMAQILAQAGIEFTSSTNTNRTSFLN